MAVFVVLLSLFVLTSLALVIFGCVTSTCRKRTKKSQTQLELEQNDPTYRTINEDDLYQEEATVHDNACFSASQTLSTVECETLDSGLNEDHQHVTQAEVACEVVLSSEEENNSMTRTKDMVGLTSEDNTPATEEPPGNAASPLPRHELKQKKDRHNIYRQSAGIDPPDMDQQIMPHTSADLHQSHGDRKSNAGQCLSKESGDEMVEIKDQEIGLALGSSTGSNESANNTCSSPKMLSCAYEIYITSNNPQTQNRSRIPKGGKREIKIFGAPGTECKVEERSSFFTVEMKAPGNCAGLDSTTIAESIHESNRYKPASATSRVSHQKNTCETAKEELRSLEKEREIESSHSSDSSQCKPPRIDTTSHMSSSTHLQSLSSDSTVKDDYVSAHIRDPDIPPDCPVAQLIKNWDGPHHLGQQCPHQDTNLMAESLDKNVMIMKTEL